MIIPPYPPGGIPTVETPTTPPPTDPAPAWWPGWAPEFPTTAPEYSAWAAAALGVVVVVVVVAAMRRRSAAALPGGHVTPPKGGGKSVDVYEKRLLRGILVLAPALLGLTFYGSFHAVEKLAEDHKVDPSWIPPVAIDGILLLFLFVDLYFAKTNRSNPFVKNTTRGFIAFTLVANAAAGWPDPVAVLLHIPAPLGIVVITEVARQALVRQAKKAAGDEDFDEIPFTRWILDPIGTASMRRWMILRNVKSYPQALAMNEARRDALAMLAALTPSQRAQVPGYLRRRLRVGMDVSTTVRSVRTLVATVTVGGHLAPFVSRVDAAAPAPAVPAPRVDEVDEVTAPASTTAYAAAPVHVDSTWTSTPPPDPVVDAAAPVVDERVDERVDEVTAAPVEPVPADVSNTSAPAPVHTVPAPVVDEVDEASPLVHPTDGVHTDGGWRAPGTHTADEGQDHEDTDPDPDDDGPRGGGSAVPTPPAGIPVLAGQTTVDEALAPAARVPSVLEDIRTAMDGPTWDDVADTGTKKDKVLAVLWEAGGDATRAAALYQERTGQDVPREIYRQNARGYAWSWHAGITSHLLNTYADTDRVRDVLANAGVEATHGAVLDTLHTWNEDHPHVVPIRRLTPSGR